MRCKVCGHINVDNNPRIMLVLIGKDLYTLKYYKHINETKELIDALRKYDVRLLKERE